MSLEKSIPEILKQELDEAISIAIDKYKREYGETKESNFSRKRILTKENPHFRTNSKKKILLLKKIRQNTKSIYLIFFFIRKRHHFKSVFLKF